jgi:hypothetical protein
VTDESYPANIMASFREVRGLRQQPAHRIVANEYDKSLAIKQDELVERVYAAFGPCAY